MSGLDGQGHPEPMTAEGAANTLKYIADDHPCCAHALKEITLWLESLCPKCNASMTYYDGWHCPTENCDTNQPINGHWPNAMNLQITIMKYTGFLFGKVGRKYIPLCATAEQVDQIEAALRRVANLNPNAGEIGAGMLKTIVEEARKALRTP